MKSKIIHFELTYNGIVVLCDDGSMWSTFATNYHEINEEGLNWKLMQKGVSEKDCAGRMVYGEDNNEFIHQDIFKVSRYLLKEKGLNINGVESFFIGSDNIIKVKYYWITSGEVRRHDEVFGIPVDEFYKTMKIISSKNG